MTNNITEVRGYGMSAVEPITRERYMTAYFNVNKSLLIDEVCREMGTTYPKLKNAGCRVHHVKLIPLRKSKI